MPAPLFRLCPLQSQRRALPAISPQSATLSTMVVSFHVNPAYARMDEVVPGLFLSGVTALTPAAIEEHGITYILNATTEVPNIRALSHVARNKLWIEDTDQTYIYPQLEMQSDQIAALLSEGHHVLVHCVAGVSRSASLVLAYLTKYRSASLRDAYDLLAAIRPMVRPNLGFWRQLITFEENVKGLPSSVKLVCVDEEDGQILPDVYIAPTEIPSASRISRRSSGDRPKFRPVLPALAEIAAS